MYLFAVTSPKRIDIQIFSFNRWQKNFIHDQIFFYKYSEVTFRMILILFGIFFLMRKNKVGKNCLLRFVFSNFLTSFILFFIFQFVTKHKPFGFVMGWYFFVMGLIFVPPPKKKIWLSWKMTKYFFYHFGKYKMSDNFFLFNYIRTKPKSTQNVLLHPTLTRSHMVWRITFELRFIGRFRITNGHIRFFFETFAL